MRIAKGLMIIGLCLILATGLAVAGDKKLKAGFVYVGPVGDYGWSHAHDMGPMISAISSCVMSSTYL